MKIFLVNISKCYLLSVCYAQNAVFYEGNYNTLYTIHGCIVIEELEKL